MATDVAGEAFRSTTRTMAVKAAQARMHVAAIQGDPIELHAAARAYMNAVNLALLADLWRATLAGTAAAWHGLRGRRIPSAGATEGGP